MRTIITVFIIIFTLSSCDYSFNAIIANNTKESVEVTMTFDRKYLDSVYGHKNYARFLPEFEETPPSFKKHYDSINLQLTITIPPHENLQVDHGLSGYNVSRALNLVVYNSIRIKYGNKDITFPKRLLDSVFVKTSRNHFELKIE